METNALAWRIRRREKQRADFEDDIAQGGVMGNESLFDNGEAFFQGGVGGKFLAQADESADDVNAHGNGPRAVEDGGRHESPMFSEHVGGEPDVALGCGHKL